MAEEAGKSSIGPNGEQNPASVLATIELGVGFGTTESTCNNNSINAAESSVVTSDAEIEKTLEYAEELMVRGSKAAKERDYAGATDCYSRALEIKVARFGELAPECAVAYYKYGCSLLYKAQEEVDPLGSVPRKEEVPQDDLNNHESTKSSVNSGSSVASVSNKEEVESTECTNDPTAVEGIDEEEEEEESDAEELAEGEEDETDLDLAWKMLDVSRAIVEKNSGDTMEKVDILSALAEVALEREDVETSLSDYLKALSILERLVEPDSRLIGELNFRVCLCLEIGSRPDEAIPYCQKAISVCKSRLQRLTVELKNSTGATESESLNSLATKEAEIETLSGLCDELEKKLEDLQQLVLNPKSILSDILGMISAKNKSDKNEEVSVSTVKSSIQMGSTSGSRISESTTTYSSETNGNSGITHLGVVGRGVKRVVVSSTSDNTQTKKLAIDPKDANGGAS